jgi:adenylate cyclase, class 2
MAVEVETKVLDIDSEKIISKLNNLGAKKIIETRLIVDWYRLKGIKNGKDPWYLRIRSDSHGKSEITWKAKSNILGTTRKHKEINIKIENPEIYKDLFEEIELEKYAHQEKDRITFKYKDWIFDIDKYPNTPEFLEIEGKDEEHVKEAMNLLGISNNRTWADGERTLIEKVYMLDWYNMKF